MVGQVADGKKRTAGTDPGALLGRAMSLHQAGRLDEAEAAYLELLRRVPDHPDALNLAGVAAHQLGRSDEGKARLRRAVAVQPDFAAAWNHLGLVLYQTGEYRAAVETLTRAAELAPADLGVLLNLGLALQDVNRLQEAEGTFRRALSLSPDHVPALINLGGLLNILNRPSESEPLLRRAAALDPGSASAALNLGLSFQARGRAAEAEAQYDRALALDPGNVQARWDRSLLRLGRGDLAGGWEDYEDRFAAGTVHPRRRFRIPRWRGEDIAGRTLLVWREQGIGDEFLFGGLYGEAIRRAGRVIIEADPRLVPLFRRSFPEATVREETGDPADADLHVPAGSLPGLFRRRLSDFPGESGWLKPDPALTERWAARLAALGPGLKVGICWTSGLIALERLGNYTRLSDWDPLLTLPGIVPVNLQYSDCAAEIAAAERRTGVRLAGWPDLDLRGDLDGVAALVASLDLVVSAPTSVGELAGALGVPVWRLGAGRDWTGLGTGARPWFPSMRTFEAGAEGLAGLPARAAHHLAALARPGPAFAPDRPGTRSPVRVPPPAPVPQPPPAGAAPGAKAVPRTPVPSPAPLPAPSLAEALALHEAGRAAEAEAAYRAVLAVRPADADALHLLGLLRFQAGDAADAEALIARAAAERPGFATAENNLANILQAAGRFAEAEARYAAALAARPDFAEALSNRGVALQELGRLAEAEDCHRRAVALRPDWAEGWTNLGAALKEAGRLGEAESCHRRAAALAPGLALAHTNLGTCLRAQGRTREADAAFDAALALELGLPLARFNRALGALETGRLAEGWAGYEHRFSARRRQPARRLAMPRWQGGDARGRRVLVWREQGLGDEIMFSGLYRDLQARVGHLVVECDPRLQGLLSRALPGATVRAATPDPRDAELEVPAGSLPGLLRPGLAGFDGRPWLAPDPALAARWAARLDALGPGLRVGICWRSGLRTAEREGLYSRLEDWAPLFALPGIRWVSLQYDAEAAEPELAAAEARSGIRIARWPDLDLADDLDGVAALTAGLDLVVSAAAAPAELSAALGVPTWRFGRRGEWTTLGTGTRPWFGSQRLFPAEPGEAVGAALGRVAAHLADLARPAPAAAAVSTPAPPAAAPEPPPGTLEAAIEHHREGRTDAAEPLYRSVLAHEPDQPVALHLLGHLLAGGRGSGGAAPERLEEGLRLMRRAVELVPDYVAALSNLAAALLAAGRPGDALERYRAARALRPGSAGILTGLGNALLALGRAGEAEAAQREAAALDPASAEVQANLGEALRAGGRLAEAEEAHRRAAALKPDWPGAWVNLGTVLAARERLEEAEAAYGRALSLDPGHPAALTNLGNLRRLQGRLPEAERLHRAALERAPGDPHALANLGLVLRDLSRHGEAAALFSRAQDAGGPEALARWNRSLSDLALGRTDTGWRDYEARFETPDGVAGRRLPMPRWQGEDIAGKRLLVWREQGLGDEILFSAHYADLQAMGVLLVVECDRRLVGLFSRLLPGALVREPTAAPDDADFHVPAGSLPGLLAPRLRDFPARPGWLRPDPGRAAAWARRLADLGPGLKVGICWRSGLLTLERRGLYLTLEELAPVLRVPGIIPVSLQYDRPEAEIAAAEAALGVRIVRWPDLDLRDDLEETAALTASLDLVVSAGTAVAEMAGALGVPVWRFAPVSDWTGLGTAVRPWFPTMRAWHPAPGQALADTGTAMAAALRAMAGVPDAVQAAPQPAAPPPAAPPPAAPALADLPTALAAHRAGRAAEAEAGYRAVLAADPDEPDALHLLGLLLHQGGRHAEGLPLVRRAAALDPGFAQAHNSLGSILRALGDGEGAGAAFRRAAGARPDYAEAWTNLGAVLAERRLPEEAEEAHRRALALRPDYPKALVNLGIARRLAGRPEEAQTAIRRALEIEPDMALAWTNLGVALTDLGRHAEAVRCHEAALARDPGMAEARNNLALARLAAGEAAQAAALLDDTAAGAPGFAPARYNRGLLALAGGDLARGWEEHEFRFAAGQAAPDRRFAIPRWEGGDLSGRRVLVWREQGLGDELMFASLYRDLAARCGHLVIECDPRLRSLFARALPGATVRSETDDPRDADLHVPAGSLPRLLRPALSRFDGAPFLAPDPAAGARWAERVRALGPGLKVGVCWRSIVRTADRDGAYTRLADWAPLFAVPGVVPVTLQYGDTEAELREAEARFGVRIHRWPDLDLRHDLDGVTALIASLDLVVTAATSVGELAGALGMPVWRFAGRNDWSMLGTGVRPWFASMRVFTAERGERAADVLPRIAAALSALAPRPEAPAEPAAHRDPLEAAVAHHREGRTAEAEALYRAVLGERPDDPAALHLLGLLRAQAGRAQEGIALMERAVALAPGYAAALVNLGNALQEAGRFGEAEARYRQALERSPGAPDALTNLGNALRAQGRLEEAAEAHRAALAASPGFAEAAANLGTVLKELDRPAEAAEQFRAALAGGRETADALTGLGDALRLLGRHGEAEALHRRAVGLAPGLAEAHNNLARVLEETGRTDAALAEYDRAVALDPGLPTARLNRALLHLGRGRTAEGWEGYAWRFEADRRHPRRRFTIPEWRGGDVSGRRVLVWREQGLGDELMFGALYRALAARCGHLVVECDPRLRGLFARALPGATVRPETDDPRDADLHVPAGSLPRLLRGFPAEPPPAGYLTPLPELALDWRERLAALGPGLKVGFCWRSRTLTTERRRAYSTLDQWGPLFRLPGIDWVSLQYDGGEEELAAAAARFGVRLHRWADADLTGDLETAAALTAGLDLVIAPATSVAEMAGALGVPAWRFGYRDWTWLGTGVRPWFPAQFPVDPGAGGIDGAIARMAARLDALRPHGNRKDLR